MLEIESTLSSELKSNAIRNQVFEKSMESEFSEVFFMSSLVGVHIFSREKGNDRLPKISHIKVISSVIGIFICSFYMSYLLFFFILGEPYSSIIWTVPFCYSAIYCIIVYINILLKRKTIAAYINRVSRLPVFPCKRFRFMILKKAFHVLLFLALVTELSTIPWYAILPAAIFFLSVPNANDIYHGVFVLSIKNGFNELTKRVSKTGWDVDEAQSIINDWLELQSIVTMHNQVSKYELNKL